MITIRVIDTETTGLRKTSDIIQAAYTDVVSETHNFPVWRIGGRQDTFLSSDQTCDIGALATHHITPDLYKNSPPSSKASAFFHWPNKPDYFAAHNADFDFSRIETDVPIICTMKCAKKLYPDAGKYSNQYLRYFLNLDLDPVLCDPPHRAPPDTWVTSHMLIHMLNMTTVTQLLEWSGNIATGGEIKVMPMGEHRGKHIGLVPSQYLVWVATGVNNLDDGLKVAAKKELDRRLKEGA